MELRSQKSQNLVDKSVQEEITIRNMGKEKLNIITSAGPGEPTVSKWDKIYMHQMKLNTL